MTKLSCLYAGDRRLVALLVAGVSFLGGHAEAATYSYVGMTYDSVTGTPCLTTSEHASIKLTLSSPLPRNVQGMGVDPTSWVANTGAHYVKSTSPNANGRFTFDTDSHGNIVQYLVTVALSGKGGYPVQMDLASDMYSGPGDNVIDGLCHGGRNDPAHANSFQDGVWTRK